jgi:hypothetical protein
MTKRTSAPRVAAITIAAMVPRELWEIPEPKLGLATAIRNKVSMETGQLGTDDIEYAAVTLMKPMAKRPSSSLVMVSEWGKLLLSPVRKNRVVASLAEDAPLSVTLSLSSRTENCPEVSSRNPKTVTAEPGNGGAKYRIRGTRNYKVTVEVRTGEIELDGVTSIGRCVIRAVQRRQGSVILEGPLAQERELSIFSNGIRKSDAEPE